MTVPLLSGAIAWKSPTAIATAPPTPFDRCRDRRADVGSVAQLAERVIAQRVHGAVFQQRGAGATGSSVVAQAATATARDANPAMSVGLPWGALSSLFPRDRYLVDARANDFEGCHGGWTR
jgi:hypothetical protein